MGEQVSRWMDCFTKQQPRVLLHGIKVSLCACGCGGEDFSIPRMGPLLELAQANPWCFEFSWDANDEKWTAIHSDMNQS